MTTGQAVPCPFCGWLVIRVEMDLVASDDPDDTHLRWFVVCDRCQAQGPHCIEEAMAISTWNRRIEFRETDVAPKREIESAFVEGYEQAKFNDGVPPPWGTVEAYLRSRAADIVRLIERKPVSPISPPVQAQTYLD